ncbi:hypothetical protein ROE7235_03745 [Roseibaca ekhonensis]|uniref:Uncharacterized protein n=1 Tax=Roseinatronobacter ekhonensis TaxID=254356 RepID=A0A3B0MZ07_9RHOB|nr:hypothetical protein [Roseibaca ekhonensis]SUZ33964.1 hypothetical protein ROE7235_03745 [Roseibaca ekhonensis]
MPIDRWTVPQMAERAARGLGKVDQLGPRGATMVSRDEVEAMAGMLALLGMTPIYPGNPTPAGDLFPRQEALQIIETKGPTDV